MFEQVRDDRLAAARAALKEVEARVGVARDASERAWRVDDEWNALLPDGLPRGRVVSVAGSTSLLLALAGQASREGAWVAAVGMPTVGVVAAARRGIDLSRLALVPEPGLQAAAVVGLCLEGVDVVMTGDRLAMSDSDRRRLASRAREQGALLLAVGAWPGAELSLEVERVRWSGLGAGDGRLRGREATVAVSGRRLGAVRRVRVELDVDRSLGSLRGAAAETREEVA
ncbi:hypothetical protein [Demequina zhanjiangensis]|uniref:Protein ImuA n=1 Tax=Demequina zhanjiangensis TaxID=3051659 RepID=A0ABT8G1V1_9MICO|nr:hypothetical protein [Demequina sp. SYSU T00b26]MDN4473108.1 hypothetical protein [Demequina sp. SYSU T00b26]